MTPDIFPVNAMLNDDLAPRNLTEALSAQRRGVRESGQRIDVRNLTNEERRALCADCFHPLFHHYRLDGHPLPCDAEADCDAEIDSDGFGAEPGLFLCRCDKFIPVSPVVSAAREREGVPDQRRERPLTVASYELQSYDGPQCEGDE